MSNITRPSSEDTTKCSASHYVDEMGYEIKRAVFLKSLLDYQGYMLYMGDGFAPLTVAVLTVEPAHKTMDDGASDALSAFEDWCRKTGRLSEIGEDKDDYDEGWGSYQYTIERIPTPVVMMPVEVNHGHMATH